MFSHDQTHELIFSSFIEIFAEIDFLKAMWEMATRNKNLETGAELLL